MRQSRKFKWFILFFAFLLPASVSSACMSKGASSTSISKVKKNFKIQKRKLSSIEKFASKSLNPSLEAKLANLLLDHNISQTTISIPAVIEKSVYHPFGDGQSNAKMSQGLYWKASDFPVVGIQTRLNDQFQREYIFHPVLKVTSYKETQIDGTWYKVQPDGWKEAFYFSFILPRYAVSDFLKNIPEKLRKFSSNRLAPDISKIGHGVGIERFKNLGEGYNVEPWHENNVHGLFPDDKGSKTALGGVLTWGIVDINYGPFKNLYTCFEPRKVEDENKYGVPSGAGWHLIGDAAESLFNNLETAPIPVAVAKTHGLKDAAYGLTEVITASWLGSDEILVSSKNSFHWYVNPYEAPVCTEIWVHKCEPNLSNNWGFKCE